MTLGFDSENLVFVPESGRLAIIDLHRWRRIVIDSLAARVRMRPETIPSLEMRIEESLAETSRKAKNKTRAEERSAAFRVVADSFVEAVRASSEEGSEQLAEVDVPGEITLWVRVSDKPAESFFPEDYDDARREAPPGERISIYGNCALHELGDLEIPFPDRENPAFELLLAEGGLAAAPLALDEPLPLVHEYCGALGVSARGNSVNVTTLGALATTHMGCTPVGRIGGSAFATLYFNLSTDKTGDVLARLTARQAENLPALLIGSHFREQAQGDRCRIYSREGDVVHLYEHLPGKESLGALTMPPFVVVAASAGSTNPSARAELLATIFGILGAR